jgi:hypothetical protein
MLAADPDDQEARTEAMRTAGKEPGAWSAWTEAWARASGKVGRSQAWEAWNTASGETAQIGEKILRLRARTAAGLLVRARVIETHDEIRGAEPSVQLMKEIRSFAKRAAIA